MASKEQFDSVIGIAKFQDRMKEHFNVNRSNDFVGREFFFELHHKNYLPERQPERVEGLSEKEIMERTNKIEDAIRELALSKYFNIEIRAPPSEENIKQLLDESISSFEKQGLPREKAMLLVNKGLHFNSHVWNVKFIRKI